MHSRIFEISEEPFESVDDYITFDWEDVDELPRGVEYVTDPETPREEDIKWLFEYLAQHKDFLFDKTYFIIGPNFKEAYFGKRFKEFKKRSEALTVSQFIDESFLDMETFYIKKSIEDELSFRVYSEECGHISLDFFLRRAEVGKKYFIGGIGDYIA